MLLRRQDNLCIATELLIADSFLARAKGLIGRRSLAEGQALLLRPCKQVHMLFMRFSIDVLFCDKDNRIIEICKPLRPWRFSQYVSEAAYAIELPAGSITQHSLMLGDELSYEARP